MCLLEIGLLISYICLHGLFPNPLLTDHSTTELRKGPGRLRSGLAWADTQTDLQTLYQNITTRRWDELAIKGSLTKCFEDLGCVTIDDAFFDRSKRPLNLLPEDRSVINTTFWLFTLENPDVFSVLKAKNAESVNKSHLKSTRKTIFIVHGYIEDAERVDWMKMMKNALLANGDYNVIIVEWSGGDSPPYLQASINTIVVGAEIAFLVKYLELNYRMNPKDVHIIGHSLGAEAAGYAGQLIPQLGRITGLDPAGPYFQGMPNKVRLDRSDATFVDIIHTNGLTVNSEEIEIGFGDLEAMGHVDFYPNGGTEQPGCPQSEENSFALHGIDEGLKRFVFCHHIRSVYLFIDHLENNQRPMVGFACQNYDSFKSGACYDCGVNSERCAPMGLDAIQIKPKLPKPSSDGSITPLKLYLETRDAAPFVLSHYQVTLKLKAAGDPTNGNLFLTLHGSKKNVKVQLGKGSVSLQPGQLYNFLVTTRYKVGDIAMVTFKWDKTTIFGMNLMLPSWDKVYVDWIRVTPMNSANAKDQELNTGTYCQRPTPQVAYSKNPITILRALYEECGIAKNSFEMRTS